MVHAPAFAPAPYPLSPGRAASRLAAPSTRRRSRRARAAVAACASPRRREVTVKFKPEGVDVAAEVGECLSGEFPNFCGTCDSFCGPCSNLWMCSVFLHRGALSAWIWQTLPRGVESVYSSHARSAIAAHAR